MSHDDQLGAVQALHDAAYPEALMQAEVLDIAERALWKPGKVSHADVQIMAAAVVAFVRSRQPRQQPAEDEF